MAESHRASASKEINPESDEQFISIPEDFEFFVAWPECCINRVPERLRSVNPSAYTPSLVSIGPLHHDDKRFRVMETQKLRYLRDFCERTRMTSSQLAEPIKGKEVTIRRCYEETSEFSSKNFIRMILLDSVFIIELLLKKCHRNEQDYILSKPWMILNVERDLMILENQLPWFILEDLFNFSFPHEKYRNSFISLVVHLLAYPYIYHAIDPAFPISRNIGKHLSGNPECFPQYFLEFYRDEEKFVVLHFVDLLRKIATFNIRLPKSSGKGIVKIGNAKILHGSGVKFKTPSRGSPRVGIKFKAGVLSISLFAIDAQTECMYRNMMAFEQCHLPYHSYVCDFIIFLGCLIKSEEDVDLLVQSGVVVNRLGESRAVSRMVNNLSEEIISTGSLYYHLSENLNAHTENWWCRSVTTLKDVYFADLWTGTGTVAAFVLLVLTFIQTFYAVKQH